MLNDIRTDFRYALRSLARTPGFAVAAILTIALGVGVNTGIFSVLNGVLFRDLPAPQAHELVSIFQQIEGLPDREGAGAFGSFSTAEYARYRDNARTLSGLLAHAQAAAMLGGEAPQQAYGQLVSCNYFEVLEQRPAIGRALAEPDCSAGADPVVVLGHELWRTAFEADPTVVGRTIELSRQLFTVVGVAREGTYGGRFRAGFFAPIAAEPLLGDEGRFANDRSGWLTLIGRRGAGVAADQLRAELAVIAAQIDVEEPGRVTSLTVDRAKPDTVPPFVRSGVIGAGAVLMTAFGLVLLIACANVGNLMLARGTARAREFAVRFSLGARRTHVIRQLLLESLLLAVIGGALGSLLALWLFQGLLAIALPTLLPVGLPMLVLDASPDLRVLAVTLALTLGAGVLFGLAPALHASRADLSTVMKQDSAGTGNRSSARLQSLLLGAQVALSMTLMIGAGLLLRGLHAAQTIDPGFASSSVVVLSYDYVSDTGHPPDSAFWQRLREDIGALPGVEAAAYASREPLGDDFGFAAIGVPSTSETDRQLAPFNFVDPAYFSVVGLPVVRGRTFTDAELVDDDARVAIVSESTARNLWGGVDPLGQPLIWRTARGEDIELRVVGVVGDAQVSALGEVDPYYVYRPTRTAEKLLLRTRADFAATAAAVRGVVRALDPGLPTPLYALDANLDRWRGIAGLATTLAASLGALALVLAAVGIYGVVSYFVGRRFREIGIRLALGSRMPGVYGWILRRTMRPVAVGAAIGATGAVAVSGALSGVLFGVSPVDPLGLSGAALFVLGVALAAGAWAARRATRVDPMVTLRYE